MKPQFLGDSYDIVKQSLLRWLAPTGPWSTHPMFTESVTSRQADCFERLLGTPLLSREVLDNTMDRFAYLAPARECKGHVFLDPDMGIRLGAAPRKKANQYLFGDELVAITQARPGGLVLVFDQSLARGEERKQLQVKLSKLAEQGVRGGAYVSHACFVLLGMDGSKVTEALETLKRESHLPDSRLLKNVF